MFAILILFAMALTTVWTVGAFDTHRPGLGAMMALTTVALFTLYCLQIQS